MAILVRNERCGTHIEVVILVRNDALLCEALAESHACVPVRAWTRSCLLCSAAAARGHTTDRARAPMEDHMSSKQAMLASASALRATAELLSRSPMDASPSTYDDTTFHHGRG